MTVTECTIGTRKLFKSLDPSCLQQHSIKGFAVIVDPVFKPPYNLGLHSIASMGHRSMMLTSADTITADGAEDELSTSGSPAVAGIVSTGVSQVRAIAALCNAAEFDAAETNEMPEVRPSGSNSPDLL